VGYFTACHERRSIGSSPGGDNARGEITYSAVVAIVKERRALELMLVNKAAGFFSGQG